MEYKRTFVTHGKRFVTVMPFSEAAMHLRVAGKPMLCELVGERPMCQLFEPDTGRPFSFPVLAGEAGLFSDEDGRFYIVEVTDDDKEGKR